MKVYQTGDISVPSNLNLTELLHTSAGAEPVSPSHVIATDSLSNRSLTLGELRDRAGRLAKGFKAQLNAQEGDRWALILPNSVDMIELFHALLWTGGTGCPINHALQAKDIGHGLAISQPKFIFAYSGTLRTINDAVQAAQQQLAENTISWEKPTIITVIGKRVGSYKQVSDFLADESLPVPHWEDTTQRIASIHLSSGTTGSPKGVQLSHYNFVANCHQLWAHDTALWSRHSRSVTFTPMVHIATTTVPLFLSPWTGIMHHLMPAFSMQEYWPLVNSVRPTTVASAPAIMLPLVRHSKLRAKFDFSQARFLMGAGAGFTPELVQGLKEMANWRIVNLYGMTEAAPYVAYQKSNQDVPQGSVGPIIPGVRLALKVVGTTEDAPEGGPGELWINGPNVASRYIGIGSMDEVNAKSFPLPGWYNTGDVCTISKDGILAVVGRTKELIKYNGFQVSPVELDGCLNQHPLVADGATTGIWDEAQITELPTAFVVLKKEYKGKEVEALRMIQKDVDATVGGYKKLRGGVWLVTEVPRNATYKILRRELKKYIVGPCSLDHETKAKL